MISGAFQGALGYLRGVVGGLTRIQGIFSRIEQGSEDFRNVSSSLMGGHRDISGG